jgi:hypothetical protein
MISRRVFSILPLAAALASCNAGDNFKVFSNTLYTDLKVVAKVLEKAASASVADLQAAADMVKPYIVPCCRLVVSMATLLNQLINIGKLSATNTKVSTAKQALDGLASNQFIATTASTGELPTAADALTLSIAIVQGVELVMQLTSGRVTPSAVA